MKRAITKSTTKGNSAAVLPTTPRLSLVPNVFNLAELRAKSAASSEAAKHEASVIQALKELLAHAKAGYITGFTFAANYTCRDGKRHDVGCVGNYLEDTVLLRGAAAKIMQAASTLDEAGAGD